MSEVWLFASEATDLPESPVPIRIAAFLHFKVGDHQGTLVKVTHGCLSLKVDDIIMLRYPSNLGVKYM